MAARSTTAPSKPSRRRMHAVQQRCSGWIDRARYLLEEALKTAPDGDAGYDAAALEDRILLSATPIVQAVADGGLETAVEAPLTFAPDVQTPVQQRRELVVIDSAAANYQQLVDDLESQDDRQLDVIVLDGQRDGIEQISEWLSEHDDVDAIHIVSHGEDGAVRLGSGWLNTDNLADYSAQLSAWSDSLDGNADLLLYGCDLAASESGRELLESLHALTGADVAGSDDDTGHSFFGGDWVLEYSTGDIETDIAFSQHLQNHWAHLLNVTVDATSLGTAAIGSGSESVSHTTAGDDRLMLVGISFGSDQGDSVGSVTYNGTAMTLVGARDNTDGAASRVEIWSLVAPDVGVHDVDVTFSGTNHKGATIGVMTFNGVDQTTALGSFASNQGNSTYLSSSVASSEGELVYSVAAFGKNSDEVLNADGGQTKHWDLFSGEANGSGTTEAGATTVDTSWSVAASGKWVVGSVPILPTQTRLYPTAEFRANTATGNTQETSLEGRGSHQAVAMAANGDYVVVWSSMNQDTSGWGVYGQLFDKDGVARGGELHISEGTTLNDQKWATVGMDAAGNFVVAWTRDDGSGGNDIYARRYDRDGVAQAVEFRVNDTSTRDRTSPSIAVAADGRFVIAWKADESLGNKDIYARRFNAAGAALDGSDILVEGGITADYDAAVAINDNGDFAVLWDDPGGVKVQRFHANGTTNGSQITVDGSGNAGNGSLALHSDGSLVVVWREGTLGSRDVYVKRFDNTGTPEAAGDIVSGSTAGDQTDPSISMDDDGNYVIVWEGAGDQAGHADTSGVFGQKYDATGAKVGDEFRINQSTSGTQHLTSVAMLNLDNFVAVWSGNGDQTNQTDASGVFVRQFGTGTLPSGQLWFTTAGNGDGGGETWTDTEILQFGDAGDTFDLNAGTTSGTISKLPGFVAPYDIRAMHYVESTVTLGTTGTQFTVEKGDLILTLDPGKDVTGNIAGMDVDRMDIVVFRPDAVGDYSSGTYSMLIDGDSGDTTSGVHDAIKAYNVHGISLVERDTVVGGTTLTKGTLLVAHSDKSLHHNIYTMNVIGTGVGASTETSEVELLLSGQALGLDGQPTDPYKLQGLHLVQQTTTFSGTTLAAGTVMVVVEGPDTYAGQVVDEFDVVALTVTQTEQDAVAGTAATGVLLFDGTDMTINTPSDELINGFTIVSSSFPGNNQPPTAHAGGPYTIDEGDSLVLSGLGSSDPNGDTLSYKWDLDNDGLFGEAGEPVTAAPTVSWATLQSFGIDDDGVYTIGVQVDDGNGASHNTTTTVTVNNAAPVLNVGGGATGTEDAVYSLTLSATDDGDDTVTQWTVDWGDGTTTTHAFAAGTATHTYTSGGNFSILVSATDEDGQHVDRDLLVAAYESGQDKVYRFDAATGEFVATLESSSGALEKPVQALVGKNGDIYVTGFDSDNVVRYDSAGNYLGEFVTSGSGGLDGASGMAFDADGNLYVASLYSNKVLRYDASGNFVDVFGSSGGGMNGPSGITFGPDGDLYVTSWGNSKVYKYDGTSGGSPSVVVANGLSNPDQIVFDTNGDLLIANGPNNTIKKFDGSLSTFASGTDNATGIALSPEGILYVSNRDDSSITMFDATSGASLGTLVASGADGLNNPYHINWIPDHQVQVAHVADTPTVTDSSTLQNTQTTTGLVVSRNPTDTSAVTHFKITNISDGVLYLNDGSTQLNNGDFITAAQGAAGLKFTPSGGFSGTASFDVQASLAGNDTGLGGGTATASITVTGNTPPTVSLNNVVSPINENTSTSGGLKVADIVIIDDGIGINTLALSGADAASFEIDGLELKLKDTVTLDYETKSSYDVTVTIDDSSLGGTPDDTAAVTINLQDVNEFDVGVISDANATIDAVDEDATIGTVVGITALAVDNDATNNVISYTLSNDADGRFTINSTTGVVTVAGVLDAEDEDELTIVVRAFSSDTSFTTKAFTIAINDTNESSVGPISDANAATNAVSEGATVGTVVGITASATDADVTNNVVSYSLDDNAGGRFAINNTTGVVTVSGTLDAETATSRTIVVRATSSDTSTTTESFTINITDVNESAVTAVVDLDGNANAVAENAAVGAAVGITASASDADVTNNVISYSLDDDAGGRFAIHSTTGVVTVSGTLDAETATSHNIVVRATSSDTSTTTESFTIAVNDVSESAVTAIVDVDGNADAVDEHASLGATVGITASASDADVTNNVVSYSLDDDAGGRFSIHSTTGIVTLSGTLDAQANPSHTIVVRATSSDTSTTVQSFTITVNDSNGSLPVFTSSDTVSIDENLTVVQTLTATDADVPVQTISFALSGGDDVSRFTINGSNQLVFVAAPNFEAPSDSNADNVYEVEVTANDGAGGTTTQAISVTVNNANEAPSISLVPNQTLNEDQSSGPLTFTIGDLETAATGLVVTASSSNLAVVDNSGITLGGSGVNRTITIVPVDNQAGSSVITLTVSDGTLTTDTSFVVVVQSVNDAPSATFAAASLTTVEDTPASVSVLPWFEDIDDAVLNYQTLPTDSSQLTARMVGDQLQIQPHKDWHGTTTVRVKAIDAAGAFVIRTVSVTVTSVNDVPVGRSDRVVVLDGSATFSVGDLMANDTDVDGDALTLQIISPPDSGTLIDLGGGRFEFQADGNADAYMTYRLFDGSVYSDPITVRFHAPQIPATPAALPPTYEAPAESSNEPSEPSQDTAPDEPNGEPEADAPAVTTIPVVPTAPPVTVRPAGIDAAVGLAAGLQNQSQGFTWSLRTESLVDVVAEATERVLGEDLGTNSREEIKAAYATAAAQIRDAITQPQMWQAIHSMQDQIDSSVSTTTLTIGATVTATTSITVGYVVWVIRGGILLSSVMANLPMWRLMDPMAILNAVDGAEEDDESLESMVDERPPAEPVGADV